MKYLIIYAHPNPASFNHAIMETISEEFKKSNKKFEVRDLYGLHFNPVLSADDLSAIQNGVVPHDIKTEQDHILSAPCPEKMALPAREPRGL
jgi:NAD(P)H dehydrogenase (quinone)